MIDETKTLIGLIERVETQPHVATTGDGQKTRTVSTGGRNLLSRPAQWLFDVAVETHRVRAYLESQLFNRQIAYKMGVQQLVKNLQRLAILTAAIKHLGDYSPDDEANIASVEELVARRTREAQVLLGDRDGRTKAGALLCPLCHSHLYMADGWQYQVEASVVCNRCKREWNADQWASFIPEKQPNLDLVTAPEYATATGVAASTIRSWATRGQVAKLGRNRAGQVLYSKADLENRHKKNPRPQIGERG
jgi:hypothetical protein